MKYTIQAVHSYAFTLDEMKLRATKSPAYDTADYNGVSMDYILEGDGVRILGTTHKYFHDHDKPYSSSSYGGEEIVKEAFWVLAEMVNVDIVYQASDEYHIVWVKKLPPKPFPEYVVPKPNYYKEIGFVLLVLAVLCLPLLAAGYSEMIEKRKLEVIKQHYIDHPDEKRLIFNCISPDFKVDCDKPWLKDK